MVFDASESSDNQNRLEDRIARKKSINLEVCRRSSGRFHEAKEKQLAVSWKRA